MSDTAKAGQDETAESGASGASGTVFSALAVDGAAGGAVDDGAQDAGPDAAEEAAGEEAAAGGAAAFDTAGEVADGAGDGTLGEDALDEDAGDGSAAGRDAGDAAGEAAPAPGRSKPTAALAGRRPMLVLCAVFSVLVVALAAIAIKLGLGLQAQKRQQDEQQAVLHAARQAAADLMTVSYRSAGHDIDRILGIATGSFHNQVASARNQLIKETDSAHAVSKANVLAAGLVGGQVTGNTATVIVVVDSTITSKNAPSGVVNHYRETITLNRTGGRWLASQVDFATPSGGQ